MEVRCLGHSCFLLKESTGTVLLTDPYSDSLGIKLPTVTADIVTVSHNHSFHNNVSKVKGNFILLNSVDVVEHKGVTVVGTKSYHDGNQGEESGTNMIYKVRMDGLDICHLGDIGEECNIDIVSDLLPVDVLLIPVGGNTTIDAEQAKEYVDALMPDIVIPMHYRTKDIKADINKLDTFLRLFDDEDIEFVDGDTYQIDRDDMQHDKTKVIVLKRN